MLNEDISPKPSALSVTSDRFLLSEAMLAPENRVFYVNNVSLEWKCDSPDKSPDLFWISSANLPSSSNGYFEFPYVQIAGSAESSVRVQEGLQFLNILHHEAEFVDEHEHGDAAEKLKVHEDGDDVDDEDVIFVKEYFLSAESAEKDKKKSQPEPRRNPKRQVQLQKASLELAMRLSEKDAVGHVRTRRSARKFQAAKKFKKAPSIDTELDPVKTVSSSKKPLKKADKSKNLRNKKVLRETINKDFTNGLLSTFVAVLDHAKEVKSDLKTSEKHCEDKKAFLNDLKDVLKYSCQLYCAVSGKSEEDMIKTLL